MLSNVEKEENKLIEFKEIAVIKINDVNLRLPRLNLQTDSMISQNQHKKKKKKKDLIKWDTENLPEMN